MTEKVNYWAGDLLGFEKVGNTFTNLIQSIDDSKVISIEAGYGRGKTFFQNAWCKRLRDAGEIVVEIDALQSDHSGDPVVTFIGALVGQLERFDKSTGEKALNAGKKFGGIAVRAVTRAVLRNGAEEVIDAVSDAATDAVEGCEALEATVTELGEGMSKVAGQIIASQLAAEHARQVELPTQLDAIKEALTENAETDRVVIVIDELDRCHPEYAIALLEAMKLVFDRKGYVFCLMVNADYLERIAAHRFGASSSGEKYLDKFVDIRLALPQCDETLSAATVELALALPLNVPYGDGEEFTVERAASLAGKLAPASGLSMRQIKRVLLKVEVALRCYSKVPLDCALLVQLAFEAVAPTSAHEDSSLSRRKLTPQKAKNLRSSNEDVLDMALERARNYEFEQFVRDTCPELETLPRERYRLPDDKNYYDWALVLDFLAPHYVPEHIDVLNGAHSMIADNN